MRYFEKMKGDRIYLSPINPEDVLTYTKWINDLETAGYLGRSSEMYSLPKERKMLEHLAEEGQNFCIVKRDGHKPLGNCSLFDINPIYQRAELGLFIGDDGERSQGYGQEAISLILDYGFNILNLNNIMLKVFSFNTRAITCYERVGFKEIGRRRESYFFKGKYHDEIYMDILAREFNQIN